MELVRNFKKLNKSNADLAGGKGASLGEMTNAGIPVPPGFVVLSASFEQFIRETDLYQEIDSILHSVNHKEIHTVDAASEKIRALILNAKMPKDIADEINRSFKELDTKYVAVRSSATAEDGMDHAWAGQLESYLNTKEDQILDKVKLCWSSLFTPRAIFYRFEKALHMTKISVAVVVQKMVESEVSGIAFSVHPVTEDWNQLIIEAGLGLGEAIVSGSVTPDSYVVEKEPRRILDINVSTQDRALYRSEKASAEHGNNEWRDIPEPKASSQVLTGAQIMELSDIIIRIEKHYGFPCDIEWAFEKGKFYIVQSRPITTLSQKTDESKKKSELSLASKQTDFDGINWNLTVTRNMSFWHQCNSNYGLYHHSKDFGVGANLESLFITEKATKCSWFSYPENFALYSKAVMSAVDSMNKVDLLKEKYQNFGKEFMESMKDVRKDLNLSNWDKFIFNYRRYCAGLTITTVIGRAGSDILVDKLKAKGIKESDIPGIIAKITYPIEHTPLFQSLIDLLHIGRDIQSKNIGKANVEDRLKSWLEEYSHIPVNFCDEPWSLDDARAQIENLLLKDCDKEIKKAEKEKDAILKEAKKLLKDIGDESISVLAHAIAEGTYLNELRKNIFSRVSLEYREIFSQVAKKCGSSNWRDCFYMTPEEMKSVIGGKKLSLGDLVKERKIAGAYTTKDGKVELLPDGVTESFYGYVKDHQGGGDKNDSSGLKEVKGFSANRGGVKGIARIVLDSKDFKRLAPGEILVTTMTSVDFVPVMERAAAFVTNEGGITSHASIVAREMNKPCVIGTKIATKVIKDGDMVEVDANKGIVKIIK